MTQPKATRTPRAIRMRQFSFKTRHIGVVVVVILLAVTLFMTLATPFSLFHLKQGGETTQLKCVILVGRHGETAPTTDHYFISEDAPDFVASPSSSSSPSDQPLTNRGKERLYLLGRYLKLRYYNSLLAGNPRRLAVRSSDSDRCLESAQALVAGLNPPRDQWIWSSDLAGWQPKAVHTTEQARDDLLSSESQCLRSDLYQTAWKNSTRYVQLLNEFRHDLQLLRQNTGLEFEDDLEMVIRLDEALKTRQAMDTSMSAGGGGGAGAPTVPAWYTPTYARRLAHIADVATGARYRAAEMQQLLVGRLLHEIIENIFDKIKADLTANGASIIGDNHKTSDSYSGSSSSYLAGAPPSASIEGKQQQQQQQLLPQPVASNKLLAPDSPRTGRDSEANMFVYMTDGQHLSALLNSLQIYTSQPHFGALLLIELHYDPVNQVHFLRLFTIDSPSHNVLPEPVRVNSIACMGDTVECSPQQFERNIRHLAMRKQAWQQLCADRATPNLMTSTPPPPPLPPPYAVTPTQRSDEPTTDATPTSTAGVLDSLGVSTTTTTTTTTAPSGSAQSGELATTTTQETNPRLDESSVDEDNMIVGPTKIVPPGDLDGREPGGPQTNEVSPLLVHETGSPTTPASTPVDELAPTTTASPDLVGASTASDGTIHLEPLSVRRVADSTVETLSTASHGPDTRDIYYMDMGME